MYKNHKLKKKTEEIHFDVVGPPSSAFPKIGRNLLAMRSPRASMAQMV